uniref:Clathrin light chain n=1 Tax=Globodera pallida TaxID=36090 RepID=A0A183CAL3_GLOPA
MSTSNDPVSEFLAREQTALADLGDDFVAAPLPQPDNEGIVLTNGGSDFGSDVNLNAFDANDVHSPVNGINGSLRGSPAFSHSHSQQYEKEPEKIRKWREQQKEIIAEKDKIEEQKKEDLRQQAKKELEQFYAQRKEELEQRKKLNREREIALKEDQSLNNQQESAAVVWERVARMIESGGGTGAAICGTVKGAKGAQSVASGKDTSRMKQLIVSYARGDQWGDKSPSPDKEADA